jgi:hypothetical protein
VEIKLSAQPDEFALGKPVLLEDLGDHLKIPASRQINRFVATKTPEQQSGMVLHRARQTSVINAIRPILPSLGSSHRSDARVSRNCSMSSLIQVTSEFLR